MSDFAIRFVTHSSTSGAETPGPVAIARAESRVKLPENTDRRRRTVRSRSESSP